MRSGFLFWIRDAEGIISIRLWKWQQCVYVSEVFLDDRYQLEPSGKNWCHFIKVSIRKVANGFYHSEGVERPILYRRIAFIDEWRANKLRNAYIDIMLDKLVDIYDSWSKGGRAKDLRQLALENKFEYSRRLDFGDQPSDIKSFKVFEQKGIKRFMGVMTCALDKGNGTIRFYDYLRTKDLETYTRSIVEIYCEDINAEYFKIEPKGVINRTKNLFKRRSKLFSDQKDFHKKYYLESRSPEVQYVLNKSALSLLHQIDPVYIEAKGNCFVFYRKQKEMPLDMIMPLVDFAEDFVGLLGTGDEEGYV